MQPHTVLQLPEGTGTVGRVCGLAVSRSIGARYAYPYVIPDPDVSEVQVLCESRDDKLPGGRIGGGGGAMGMSSLSEPAANVTAGDVWALLLCSDGVWDALTDQEAAEVNLRLPLALTHHFTPSQRHTSIRLLQATVSNHER